MTAAALSQEPKYENKVFVVDNGRVSTPLHRSILDAIDLVEDGYTAPQIKDILEASREKTVIHVGLSTLEYLKKGGRINHHSTGRKSSQYQTGYEIWNR